MPLAAGWPLRGEMSVMCTVVLLTGSADCHLHTQTRNRARQAMCWAISFLRSFSVVQFPQKHSVFRRDAHQSPKGVHTLELCPYSCFSTTADSLHSAKLTTLNIFPRIKIQCPTREKKESVCSRNNYQYVP